MDKEQISPIKTTEDSQKEQPAPSVNQVTEEPPRPIRYDHQFYAYSAYRIANIPLPNK